ncbi:MAG TPA: hypothetical protein PK280_13635 [Planctomycetota bacterium]|nr:hypothetical protein [Planctomycetota bacterium]
MRIRKATTLKDLEAVWQLTHDMFVTESYAEPQPDGMLRHYPHLDLLPETTVLMAEDDDGTLLGSVSYTVDGPAGLHVDDDFRDVVDAVREDCRAAGRRLGASWRIVTRPGCREHLQVVMQLISATLDGGRQVADTVLFTFNPKHESFYGRMLGLRTVCEPRAGHSVQSAPAILMRGEMAEMLARWERVMARRSSARLPAVKAPAAELATA